MVSNTAFILHSVFLVVRAFLWYQSQDHLQTSRSYFLHIGHNIGIRVYQTEIFFFFDLCIFLRISYLNLGILAYQLVLYLESRQIPKKLTI